MQPASIKLADTANTSNRQFDRVAHNIFNVESPSVVPIDESSNYRPMENGFELEQQSFSRMAA